MIKTIDDLNALMKLAEEGGAAKSALADLLTSEARQLFLDRCAVIEKQLTARCGGEGDPCLASGCALEGEACLNAVLNADSEYHKACAAEWLSLFADPANRLEPTTSAACRRAC